MPIASPTILYLNDFDTSRLGLVVESYAGALSAAEQRMRTAVLLGRAGVAVLDRSAEQVARTLLIRGTVIGDSVAQTVANLQELRARLNQGLLEVRFASMPGRVWYCWRRSAQAEGIGAQDITAAQSVTIELQLTDAYHYEAEPTHLRLNTGRTDMLLGTAPSAPTFELMGSGTDPVIRYRRADGTLMGEMNFLGLTLAGWDYLRVDADAQVLTYSNNGTITVNNNLLTSGRFFALDPMDGDPATGSWPTVEVLGVTMARVSYQKAFV